ncbi:chemotaxis protein [Massilia eurypsychrophila]|jgi:methyl-accepting chemotaxis protein|uniref:Chemotaxis protein n=1 Tax=Massilia eurypsychrophila TaxID=1485217 RepID=A0A2G8TLF5_9BURK|nr:methyl-accepting chemotaxis protein [Massilia eurypsychrophila]PIL46856.1 chemotaxis protein [Massilia eurypsychrophila]
MDYSTLAKARPALVLAGAAGASTLIIFLINQAVPGALGPVAAALLASTASLALVRLAGSGNGSEAARSRAFIDVVGHAIDDMMIGAAETSYFVDSVKKKVELDVRTAAEVAASAQEVALSTRQIAANAQQAATVAAKVRSESVAGRAEIEQGLQRISSARTDARQGAATMAELQERARRIAGFTEVISEISARTNLLALNAAIEAARAGEHGRGFAVVASEVRQLALRTKEATDEISVMVRVINEQTTTATGGMVSLTEVVGLAAGNVERVHALLGSIEQSAAVSEREIGQIAAAARVHVGTTGMITESLAKIRDSMLSTDAELPRAARSAMALAEQAESIVSALGDSAVQTPHDPIRIAAQGAADQVGRLFSAAIRSGAISREALFDRRYKAIPNTNPPKHNSRFDAFTDRALPDLQEALLSSMPQLAYAGAVDSKGYFPTHNKKFSQPLTGDYDVDIIHNRTKRIFNDRTGARCGSNTRSFLLQTYKRDTGEVMHDLSAPIYVDGQHWGGFRVGYRSSAA